MPESYDETLDDYRDLILEKLHTYRLSTLKAGLMFGKLDEWEAEYERREGANIE